LVEVEQWAEIRRMHFVCGLSIKEIVRRTGRDRNTVRRALRATAPPKYSRTPAPSKLDPFKDEIHRLLSDDSKLPGQRVRELIEQLGYAGSKTILDDYLREVRPLFCPPPRTFQRTAYAEVRHRTNYVDGAAMPTTRSKGCPGPAGWTRLTTSSATGLALRKPPALTTPRDDRTGTCSKFQRATAQPRSARRPTPSDRPGTARRPTPSDRPGSRGSYANRKEEFAADRAGLMQLVHSVSGPDGRGSRLRGAVNSVGAVKATA
jgi:hypothetical protein